MMNIIKVSLFLAMICLISASTLAVTYDKTKPIIEKNSAEKYKQSLKIVMPDATVFAEKKIDGKIVSVGKNDKDEFVGFATVVSPTGYAGPIDTMVGVDKDGKITGIIIQKMVETPGLGTKANEPWFKKQFVGKSSQNKIQVKKDGGTIDAITAATISSRAVCKGVKKVADLYKSKLDKIKALNPLPVKKEKKETVQPEPVKSEGKGVSE